MWQPGVLGAGNRTIQSKHGRPRGVTGGPSSTISSDGPGHLHRAKRGQHDVPRPAEAGGGVRVVSHHNGEKSPEEPARSRLSPRPAAVTSRRPPVTRSSVDGLVRDLRMRRRPKLVLLGLAAPCTASDPRARWRYAMPRQFFTVEFKITIAVLRPGSARASPAASR
jgi:hypothetical protein